MCLLLFFGAVRKNRVSILLSYRPLVLIGLISYSLYLVHQPLLSFCLVLIEGHLTPPLTILLTVLSLVLAYLSWRFVEQPFRDRRKVSGHFIFVASAVSLCLVFVVGTLVMWYAKSAKNRILSGDVPLVSPMRASCHASDSNYIDPDDACILGADGGGSKPSIAVFGDSHGVELSYALSITEEQPVVSLTYSACPPVVESGLYAPSKCAEWSSKALTSILINTDIDTVYVVYRIHKHLHGDQLNWYPDIHPIDEVSGEIRTARWGALVSILTRLKDSKRRVILVLQPPELAGDIKYLTRSEYSSVQYTDIYGVPYSWWERRTEFVINHLATIPDGVDILDPSLALCDSEHCYVSKKGSLMYFDDDHLSVAGALYVLKYFERSID